MKSGGGGSAAGVGETAFAKRENGCENRCETVAEGEEAATAIQAAIRGRQQRKLQEGREEHAAHWHGNGRCTRTHGLHAARDLASSVTAG